MRATKPIVRLICIPVLCITSLVSGCAGGHCRITHKADDYPVSLSKAVFDQNGTVVIPEDDELIADFSIAWKNWTILWTLVSLSDTEQDLSEDIRQVVEEHGGNAVVNLKVEATEDWFWYLSSLVPIFPTFIDIEVSGDIARISDEERSSRT